MVASMHHRGPNAHGTYVDDHVSLGHTRLSILDLSASGAQPMSIADSGVVVTYNGEIYNFQDLRRELESRGHHFKGSSDTEVLATGYLEWGPDVFSRCNGMWGIGIYDGRSHELLLSRDRLGVKPLYYHRSSRGLAFASEIQALLPILQNPTVDPEAVDFLLSSQFIPSPKTIYKGVEKLEPGHLIRYNINTNQFTKFSYYEPPAYRPQNDRQALVDEGKSLFEDAVRIRLVSDVPVGAFLSGGLDSTAVVGAMSGHIAADKLHTVSAGFEIEGLDETPYIEAACREIPTTHHHIIYRSSDVTSSLETVSRAFGEPLADPSALPTHTVSEEASRWMTVCLSGDGADEVFGGYENRLRAGIVEHLMRIPAPLRRGLMSVIPAGRNPDARTSQVYEALRLSLGERRDYFAEIGSRAVYRPEVFKQWASERLGEMLCLTDGDLLEALLKFDIHHNRLGDNYCAKVDRMSMAHSLEVRSPFLDYRFVELASRIPTKWKLHRGETKILMREIVADYVPAAILNRNKHGFAAPVGVWADENIEALRTATTTLHEAGLIDHQWRVFLHDNILSNDNWITREYRKRLAFLWSWYQAWILKIEFPAPT